MDDKYGFVYIWYDRKHKRYYVGAHWGTENDGYICSSSWMKKAFIIRKKDFKRRIIFRTTEKETLSNKEYEWLQLIKEEELGKRYYNLKNHYFHHWTQNKSHYWTGKSRPEVKNFKGFIEKGRRAWNKGKPLSEEHREKLKGPRNISQETRDKWSEKRKGLPSPMEGKKHTEETKKKMKEKRKLQVRRPHSEETKKKIAESNRITKAKKKEIL